jgi:hypothetical protein
VHEHVAQRRLRLETAKSRHGNESILEQARPGAPGGEIDGHRGIGADDVHLRLDVTVLRLAVKLVVVTAGAMLLEQRRAFDTILRRYGAELGGPLR